MIAILLSLFGWMPPILQIVVYGVISVFVLLTVLKVVKLILDIIPVL